MTNYFSRSSKLSFNYNLMKMVQQFGLSFADCDIIVNNVGADTFIYLKNGVFEVARVSCHVAGGYDSVVLGARDGKALSVRST